MATKKPFNPLLYGMEDGSLLDTRGLNSVQLAQLGQQSHDAYRGGVWDQFLQNQQSGVANASMAPSQGASPAGSMWDGYHGFMRGRMFGAGAQGRGYEVDADTWGNPGAKPTTRFDNDQVSARTGQTLLEDQLGAVKQRNPSVALRLLMKGGY